MHELERKAERKSRFQGIFEKSAAFSVSIHAKLLGAGLLHNLRVLVEFEHKIIKFEGPPGKAPRRPQPPWRASGVTAAFLELPSARATAPNRQPPSPSIPLSPSGTSHHPLGRLNHRRNRRRRPSRNLAPPPWLPQPSPRSEKKAKPSPNPCELRLFQRRRRLVRPLILPSQPHPPAAGAHAADPPVANRSLVAHSKLD